MHKSPIGVRYLRLLAVRFETIRECFNLCFYAMQLSIIVSCRYDAGIVGLLLWKCWRIVFVRHFFLWNQPFLTSSHQHFTFARQQYDRSVIHTITSFNWNETVLLFGQKNPGRPVRLQALTNSEFIELFETGFDSS